MNINIRWNVQQEEALLTSRWSSMRSTRIKQGRAEALYHIFSLHWVTLWFYCSWNKRWPSSYRLVPGFSSVITPQPDSWFSLFMCTNDWHQTCRTCGRNVFTAEAWSFCYDVMAKRKRVVNYSHCQWSIKVGKIVWGIANFVDKAAT